MNLLYGYFAIGNFSSLMNLLYSYFAMGQLYYVRLLLGGINFNATSMRKQMVFRVGNFVSRAEN